MKNRFIFLIILSIVFLDACSHKTFTTHNEGIIVQLKKTDEQNTRLVRIQVISDDIFRVSATPDETLADKESLSVVKRDSVFRDWKVTEEGNTLELSTASTIASLSLITGQVSFFDRSGKMILKEMDKGR